MWNQVSNWVSSRENVTFLIAISGFLLSVWNFAESKIKNRRALLVMVRNVFVLGPNPEGEYLEVLNIAFVNKSREAIALSRLRIACGDSTGVYGELREKLIEHSHKVRTKETSRSTWFSDVFPVKLEGLDCANLLICSSGGQRCIEDGKKCQIELFTNKGIIRSDFIAHFSGVELLWQCREPNSEVQALK